MTASVLLHQFAFAHQRQAHVAQWCEVTAGTEGALARHHRHQALVVEIDQAVHRLRLDAAVPTDQAADLEQQHPPDDRGRKRLPQAGGMAAQDVLLQLVQHLPSHLHMGELAESRIDPVHRPA